MTELGPGDDSILTPSCRVKSHAEKILDKVERDPEGAGRRLNAGYIARQKATFLKETLGREHKEATDERRRARNAGLPPKAPEHPEALKLLSALVTTHGVVSDAPLADIAHPRYWHRSAEHVLNIGDEIVVLNKLMARRFVLRVDSASRHTRNVSVTVLENYENAEAGGESAGVQNSVEGR